MNKATSLFICSHEAYSLVGRQISNKYILEVTSAMSEIKEGMEYSGKGSPVEVVRDGLCDDGTF